ncbi:MAG: hypothetical protein JWO03_3633 [Bacteroidetes bacterium]|nr:hypothetical protein [Bacteroidota bacterium]
MEQGNYLKYSVAATFGLIACLGLLYAIPVFDIGSFHYRRVNILSDILYKEPVKPVAHVDPKDSTIVVKPVYVAEACKKGITCIEDYSPDSTGMNTYLAALDSSDQKIVRIAYFADSYVEGDIMLEPFRDSMQAIYGGSGVGFVPITSEVAGFRQSIIHSFKGWATYSMVGDRSNNHPLGPAGLSFVPKDNNEVIYKAARFRHLNSFPTTELFYKKCTACAVIHNEHDTIGLAGDKAINAIKLNRNSQYEKLNFICDSMDLYGMSFEDTKGISVDNFSVRGNSGTGLNYVSEDMYRSFGAVHPYQLIVLSYGLNVASEKQTNYSAYAVSMSRVIQRFKNAFPNSSILLVGCSDRGANMDGDFMTLPTLHNLIDAQRKVAADNGICFWDLQTAMGGDSTMIRWVDMKLANDDYTHLTFKGGRKVADILIGTLRYEKEKYDRRKKLTITKKLTSSL